jgi:peptide/nickel transport system permease protein
VSGIRSLFSKSKGNFVKAVDDVSFDIAHGHILGLVGESMLTVIMSMMIIMWRSTARVIRSQVLSLRERPFVDAARISGASSVKIIYYEIAPNILPIALVNVAFALAWAIITEASIGFLGIGDPTVLSWGTIIYRAFASEMSYKAWWWVIPPGRPLCSR